MIYNDNGVRITPRFLFWRTEWMQVTLTKLQSTQIEMCFVEESGNSEFSSCHLEHKV